MSKKYYYFSIRRMQLMHFDIRRIQLVVSCKEPRIKVKFLKAGFPRNVIETLLIPFNNVDGEIIITRWFFDKRKTVVINLPFSNKNENSSKKVMRKVRVFYKW